MCKSAVGNQSSYVVQRNGLRLCFPFISIASNAAYLSPVIYYIFQVHISPLKKACIVTNCVVPRSASAARTILPQIAILM
jgi:hypothetical protein